MLFDFDLAKKVYSSLEEKQEKARNFFGRPITYAEKILFSHLSDYKEVPERGKSYLNFNPDRVAMQDATAQMALLQFMHAGKDKVMVPSTVHADHLLQAKLGSKEDLSSALATNKEVYDFLKSASQKYGIGFWGPGSGIIHQIVLENYAFPGSMMIGTDSHTPNAGGLGMIAIGVGGADAVDVMAGMPWELKWPKLIGVKLTGKLSAWSSPKDIILKLAGLLTVKGGTGYIIEYFGDAVQSLSTTGKATITNMGAEVGATTSLFPYDKRGSEYLRITGREKIADLADSIDSCLRADNDVVKNPEKYFDKIIEINLSELEPHIVGPFTPDLDRPISKMKDEVKEKKYPVEPKVSLIGSCTNSSYEDLTRVASIIRDAKEKGLKAKTLFYISPGSEQIYETIKRDGLLDLFEEFGAIVLTNSCGPCIGQWDRQDFKKEEANTIITSFNRNFRGRNDGNKETLAFISSPEIVTALSIAGRIDFNPMTDTLINKDGEEVSLNPPVGFDLPPNGFKFDPPSFEVSEKLNNLEVIVNPHSDRLQLLDPFPQWDAQDSTGRLPVLLKAWGKCTTDHVSPAGKWLKYRGHLDNISNNMYLGANNNLIQKIGQGKNIYTNEIGSISNIARQYKAKNKFWAVIADENYGEGSSREHAAMEPRFLGMKLIVARSFARIAENNLKKQGVIPATFANSSDYDLIRSGDEVEVSQLQSLAPDSILKMKVYHKDGTQDEIDLLHSFSSYQISWFKAGSALNFIKQKTQNG